MELPSLLDLTFGYAPAQIIHTAARLGIADELAEGPRTTAELAQATGTHQRSLHRLLRGLVCLGVLAEPSEGRFELTTRGQPLRGDVPGSVRQLILLSVSAEVWQSWGELEYSVRTGKPSWDKVTGLSSFEFWARNPEQRAVFNAAMSNHTRSVAPTLIEGYDFGRFTTLVDLGGGDGTLLAAILRAVPGLHGVLFDQPAGLESAATTLAAADVADRCTVVTGSFFESVPEGADAYLLKSVIHDWDDDHSVEILANCRKVMADTARVLIIEPVLPARVSAPVDTQAIMSDLNMLVLTQGWERTEEEFRALYAAAGIDLISMVGPLAGYWIIEGAPTPSAG